MKIEHVVMELDKPNRNGRMYPTLVMQEAIEKYKTSKKDLFVFSDTSLNLRNLVGRVDALNIIENNVSAEVSVFDTPDGLYVKHVVNNFGLDSLEITCNGIGDVAENGVISNYTLTSMTVNNKTY